jgi:hypothetical protein
MVDRSKMGADFVVKRLVIAAAGNLAQAASDEDRTIVRLRVSIAAAIDLVDQLGGKIRIAGEGTDLSQAIGDT